MSDIISPLGSENGSWFADNAGVANEHLTSYVGRLHKATDRVPVLYFHGFFGDGLVTLAGLYQTAFGAITATSLPLLVPELGGGSQWATSDVVGTSGLADRALGWAVTDPIVTGTGFTDAVLNGLGVDPAHVAVHGWSMGGLNGLNWCWRNARKVRAAVLVGPIVDFEKFYNDNPSFQGAIDADWGSHSAFLAGLPSTDPMRNIDLIRPFGHRIQLWYAEQDEFIDPADVQAFAELVGAEAHGFPGTHADLITVPADQAAVYTLAKVRERASAYVGWDPPDWGRFEHVVANYEGTPHNTYEHRTVVAPGGRRGEVVRVSGPNENERHLYYLNDVSAADVSVTTVWHGRNGGEMISQQGNFCRGIFDPDTGAYAVYMNWHNVLFGVPWIVNMSRWTGTSGLTMVQNGTTTKTIPGLRRIAGGAVLASERTGGVVTLVVSAADADRAYRSGVIDVAFDGVALGGYTGLVARVDANHLQYTQAGSDVASGGPGTWADFASCFPYVAQTELQGLHMRGRYYAVGQDPPDWSDTDWTMEWDDNGSGHTSYGRPGIFQGHLGIFAPPPGLGAFQQFGPVTATEM